MSDYILYFDGSCTPNPGGIATYSYVLEKDEGKIGADIIIKFDNFLGEGEDMTCNLAEYKGLIEGLRFIGDNFEKMKPSKIIVRGDSQLVVNQSGGKWKVNADNLKDSSCVVANIITILNDWKCQVVFEWVPREQNKLADKLTQKALKDYRNKIKSESKPATLGVFDVVLGCDDCPKKCREYLKPGDKIFMFCSAQGEYGRGDWRVCVEK